MPDVAKSEVESNSELGETANRNPNGEPQISSEELQRELLALDILERQAAISTARLGRNIDGLKTFCDFYKHIATLSTGAVLIFLGLRERLPPHPLSKVFAIAVIAPFIIAVGASLISFQSASFMIGGAEISERTKKEYAYSAAASIGFFMLGLIMLIIAIVFSG